MARLARLGLQQARLGLQQARLGPQEQGWLQRTQALALDWIVLGLLVLALALELGLEELMASEAVALERPEALVAFGVALVAVGVVQQQPEASESIAVGQAEEPAACTIVAECWPPVALKGYQSFEEVVQGAPPLAAFVLSSAWSPLQRQAARAELSDWGT